MILTNLKECSDYESRHPLFSKLFEFLKTTDFNKIPDGKIVLEGENLFINHVHIEGRREDTGSMEVHKDYIDLHFLISGEEKIGIKKTVDVTSFSKPYDSDSDCALTEERPVDYIELKPGDMAIISPKFAHLPAVSSGPIHKLIAKIHVSPCRSGSEKKG